MLTAGRYILRFLALAAVTAASFWFAHAALAQQTPPQQPAAQQAPSSQAPGNINGTVTDTNGNPIVGAQVTLTHGNPSSRQQVLTGDNGEFAFPNILPGPFQLSVSAPPFADQNFSGTLAPGQDFIVPQFKLVLATVNTVVRVQPQAVVAERQIKQEEQQRVLKVFPNFYVTYIPNAAPLDTKQKFELAWKDAIDPITFILIGATAGLQMATNQFPGYGEGALGYAKNYGSAYADFASGALFGSVVFPSILKQDPRYFYKATGSKRQRVMYALANAVICKGDNGRWQPNYSSVLGNLASGGLANTYYPPKNRGVGLAFQVAGVGIALTGVANIAQEFIIPKFTSHKPKPDQTTAP